RGRFVLFGFRSLLGGSLLCSRFLGRRLLLRRGLFRSGLLGGRLLLRRGAGLGRQQGQGGLHRHVFGRRALRQGGVDLARLAVGAVASGHDLHGLARFRVGAQLLQRRGGRGAACTTRTLFGQQGDRAVQADVEHLL